MIEFNWDRARQKPHNLRVVTCGYETRATFVCKSLPSDESRVVVLDYDCPDMHSYNDNKVYYENLANANLIKVDDLLIEKFSKILIDELDRNNEETVSIFFDISSCSRSLMASILLCIEELATGRVDVTLFYALSAFETAPVDELPSHISEPVVGDLSGWSSDITKPPCAVIGLGFEPGRALGCIDYLEISEVRLFLPIGADERFEHAVKSANSVLIDEAGSQAVLPYDILNPTSTYEKIESLVHGLLPDYRPVLIPLGPKIFAALCIVIAIKNLPDVCVWRTSSGMDENPGDLSASGPVACFETRF